MSVLRDLRITLITDLAVLGVPVFAAWPTEVTLPCVYVLPPLGGGVHLVAGPCFGEYTVSTDVVILAEHGDPVETLETLETLLELALANTVDWTLVGVEPPTPMTVSESGAEYLGSVMHLSKPVRL